MRLKRLREPFDHRDWLFEIKHDGFRGLAFIEHGRARLVSRNGNTFKSFAGLCAWLGEERAGTRLHPRRRERLPRAGWPGDFRHAAHRRAEPHLYAFDCLWLDGRDLRSLPLIERKRILRSLVPPQPSRLLYVDHVAERGLDLFRAACETDLEGIVAKLADAPYGTEPSSWIKIKNAAYSQAIGRRLRAKRTASAG